MFEKTKCQYFFEKFEFFWHNAIAWLCVKAEKPSKYAQYKYSTPHQNGHNDKFAGFVKTACILRAKVLEYIVAKIR